MNRKNLILTVLACLNCTHTTHAVEGHNSNEKSTSLSSEDIGTTIQDRDKVLDDADAQFESMYKELKAIDRGVSQKGQYHNNAETKKILANLSKEIARSKDKLDECLANFQAMQKLPREHPDFSSNRVDKCVQSAKSTMDKLNSAAQAAELQSKINEITDWTPVDDLNQYNWYQDKKDDDFWRFSYHHAMVLHNLQRDFPEQFNQLIHTLKTGNCRVLTHSKLCVTLAEVCSTKGDSHSVVNICRNRNFEQCSTKDDFDSDMFMSICQNQDFLYSVKGGCADAVRLVAQQAGVDALKDPTIHVALYSEPRALLWSHLDSQDRISLYRCWADGVDINFLGKPMGWKIFWQNFHKKWAEHEKGLDPATCRKDAIKAIKDLFKETVSFDYFNVSLGDMEKKIVYAPEQLKSMVRFETIKYEVSQKEKDHNNAAIWAIFSKDIVNAESELEKCLKNARGAKEDWAAIKNTLKGGQECQEVRYGQHLDLLSDRVDQCVQSAKSAMKNLYKAFCATQDEDRRIRQYAYGANDDMGALTIDELARRFCFERIRINLACDHISKAWNTKNAIMDGKDDMRDAIIKMGTLLTEHARRKNGLDPNSLEWRNINTLVQHVHESNCLRFSTDRFLEQWAESGDKLCTSYVWIISPAWYVLESIVEDLVKTGRVQLEKEVRSKGTDTPYLDALFGNKMCSGFSKAISGCRKQVPQRAFPDIDFEYDLKSDLHSSQMDNLADLDPGLAQSVVAWYKEVIWPENIVNFLKHEMIHCGPIARTTLGPPMDHREKYQLLGNRIEDASTLRWGPALIGAIVDTTSKAIFSDDQDLLTYTLMALKNDRILRNELFGKENKPNLVKMVADRYTMKVAIIHSIKKYAECVNEGSLTELLVRLPNQSGVIAKKAYNNPEEDIKGVFCIEKYMDEEFCHW